MQNSSISPCLWRRFIAAVLTLAAVILTFAGAVQAADAAIQNTLPATGFAEGWTLDGKIASFDKDNLFDHINGEAELYFPYGFEAMASARYINQKSPDLSIVADVYQMGSLLDAFGIYANYRKASNTWVAIGAEGFISATQLLFYQDRYFVRLQVAGDTDLSPDAFMACARAISAKLPKGSGKPKELQSVKIAALLPQSERYLAQSLLGYAFFRRGIIATASVDNEKMQIIAICENSKAEAEKTFDQYLAYLKTEAQKADLTENAARRLVLATDPLYGGVQIEQSGRYIIGVIRIKNTAAAGRILEQLRQQIKTGTGG